MTRQSRTFVWVLGWTAVASSVGCSQDTSQDATNDSVCDSASSCLAHCFCRTGELEKCVTACEVGSGGAGGISGAAGVAGDGGTGAAGGAAGTSGMGGGGSVGGAGGSSASGGAGGTAGSGGAGAMGGSGNASCETDDGSGWNTTWQSFECQVVGLVNQRRAQGAACGGVPYPPAPALVLHPNLKQSARGHAQDMGVHGFVSHSGSDGSSPFARMQSAGYSGGTMGENVAGGQSSPAAVMSSWMQSPGHCKNIMNAKFKHIGVGYFNSSKSYKHFWVQNFGG